VLPCPITLWWVVPPFQGGEKPQEGIFGKLLTTLSLCGQILHGEARFYQGMLILRQSYHDDYACSHGGSAMSGGDGMNSSTHVPAVRCVWVPTALSCHVRHSMSLPSMAPTPIACPITESPQAWLPGARAHFKPGREDDLLWSDR
jgi:hypothetical protein